MGYQYVHVPVNHSWRRSAKKKQLNYPRKCENVLYRLEKMSLKLCWLFFFFGKDIPHSSDWRSNFGFRRSAVSDEALVALWGQAIDAIFILNLAKSGPRARVGDFTKSVPSTCRKIRARREAEQRHDCAPGEAAQRWAGQLEETRHLARASPS
jgi:hypothetical protein